LAPEGISNYLVSYEKGMIFPLIRELLKELFTEAFVVWGQNWELFGCLLT